MLRVGRIFAAWHLLFLCCLGAQPAAPEPTDGPTGNPPRRHFSAGERHSFGENVVILPNEVVGDLVLFGGSLDVQGVVEGDVVMIGGSVTVSGEITGGLVLVGGGLDLGGTIGRDAVVVLGGADVEKEATIDGNAVFVGGPFHISNEAEISGEKKTIPLGNILPKVEWFKAWLVKGLLLGRLLPLGVTWPWITATFALLFYFLVLILFPAGVKLTFSALELRPIASLIAGLLAMILAAPLAVVLAITVVGIAAIPFVMIAFLLALIVGKVGVICFLGRSVGRVAGGQALQAPLLAFLAGAVLLTLVYTVPVIGLVAWGLGTVFGLGAALVALGQSFSREESQALPMPVPASTIRPEMAPEGMGIASSPEAVALPLQPPVTTPPLTTPETLLLRRAGFWRRFVAAALDLILLSLLIPVLGPVFVPVAIVYFVGMWTWKGTTIGSIVMGLKVIRTDGRPINFTVALVRSLSSFFSALVLFLGFLWAAWDRDKQTWHDKIAGTVVVLVPRNLALI